jgi:glycosyltransferase involved in cell wall biosynthesis
VLSVHNAFPPAVISDWHQPLLQQAFQSVRGIYAVSESAMAHFLAIYQPYISASTRLAVIPNCVDTALFVPSAQARAAARTRLGLPVGALVMGVVARLSGQKRPDAALALLVLLRRRWSTLYLVLAGTGPMERELRQMTRQAGLEDVVIFTGFVDNVEQLLPAFDLHLLMSRNEGFGIATIEAMACGVPAVATEVPGSVDILRGSQGGCLIPPDDLPAAAAIISELLADPARRAHMALQGRAEAELRYSQAVVGRQVRAFYDGLA